MIPNVTVYPVSQIKLDTSTLTRKPIRQYTTHLDRYFAYIYERQLVWYRRFAEKLPSPWTDDSVICDYSFTNVYRELDRGTLHFQNVAWPVISKHIAPDQFFWVTVYRWFNRTEVWDAVLENHARSTIFSLKNMEKDLRDYAATGYPIWTGAYMVCAYAGFPGEDKLARVINFLATIFIYRNNAITPRESTEHWHSWMMLFDGIGPLNAYEIMSDLLMVNWEPFKQQGFTENDWANPGPGAEKGLRLVFANATSPRSFSRSNMVAMMRELRDIQQSKFAELELPFQAIALYDETASGTFFPRWLTMRNIEHNLCEYSKYDRGRSRNRFTPRTVVTNDK